MSQEVFDIQSDELEESVVKPGRQREINEPDRLAPGSFHTDSPAPDEAARKPRSRQMPEYVQNNFLEVNGSFYFQNKEPAFSFKKDVLRTKSTSPEVVKAFIEIAKEQEWASLSVSGNKNFRRALWLEATAQGFEVSGYRPTKIEKAQAASMAKRLQAREREKEHKNTVTPDRSREAAKEQAPQPEPVPKKKSEIRAEKSPTSEILKEKVQAFKTGEKVEVLKKFPDLAKAYASLTVAEKFADKNIPLERKQDFIQGIKDKYTEKIQNDEYLPAPTVKRASVLKLYEQARKHRAESVRPLSGVDTVPSKTPTLQKRIVERGSNYYMPFDAGHIDSYLSLDKKARIFTSMLREGGLTHDRALLIAEVSKLKESVDPQGFRKEMIENKRMFESLANESTKEKCRVLAMMYDERIVKLRYNEQGEINDEVAKALFNRQNKIREELEQYKKVQMIENSQKPAPLTQRPPNPSNPSKTVDLDNREQFVAYISRAGVAKNKAEKLYQERQNRKIAEPRSYAQEIEYERNQIAQMLSITQSDTKTEAKKAEELNMFVATNIIRSSDEAKKREGQERIKFTELMERNGIKSERARVIYETRKIQKEVDPQQYAREQNQLKNIMDQCKAEGVSPAESEKRVSQVLLIQYGSLKDRAMRDTNARDIVINAINAEAMRIEQIRQQQRKQERERAKRQKQEQRERAQERKRSEQKDQSRSRTHSSSREKEISR